MATPIDTTTKKHFKKKTKTSTGDTVEVDVTKHMLSDCVLTTYKSGGAVICECDSDKRSF